MSDSDDGNSQRGQRHHRWRRRCGLAAFALALVAAASPLWRVLAAGGELGFDDLVRLRCAGPPLLAPSTPR